MRFVMFMTIELVNLTYLKKKNINKLNYLFKELEKVFLLCILNIPYLNKYQNIFIFEFNYCISDFKSK